MTVDALTRAVWLRSARRMLVASREELRAAQEDRLRLVREAASRCEPYRTRYAQEGIGPEAKLDALPVTRRTDVMAYPLEERLAARPEGMRVTHTGGSTGVTLSVARSPSDAAMQDVLLARQLAIQGIPVGTPRILIDAAFRREALQLSVGTTTEVFSVPAPAASLAHRIAQSGAQTIISLPSYLVEIANVGAPAGVRWVLTFGESMDTDMRRTIQDAFGTEPMDMYASTEGGLMAWQCRSRGPYHVNADWVMMEVLDETLRPVARDRAGDLVISVLTNLTTPFLRYAQGDVVRAGTDGCACGVTLPTLEAIEGRRLDWGVDAAGRLVAPFRFMPAQLVGEQWYHWIQGNRIVQRDVDDIHIQVKWRERPGPDLHAQLTALYGWLVGCPVRVEIEEVDGFPSTGKVRVFRCLVPRAHSTESPREEPVQVLGKGPNGLVGGKSQITRM